MRCGGEDAAALREGFADGTPALHFKECRLEVNSLFPRVMLRGRLPATLSGAGGGRRCCRSEFRSFCCFSSRQRCREPKREEESVKKRILLRWFPARGDERSSSTFRRS